MCQCLRRTIANFGPCGGTSAAGACRDHFIMCLSRSALALRRGRRGTCLGTAGAWGIVRTGRDPAETFQGTLAVIAQMILVAGPYRSGTNDDPALIAKNVEAMTETSLRLFRAGHLPVMGEGFALPLIEHAGGSAASTSATGIRWHPPRSRP